MTDSMSTEMELAEALALLDQDPPTQTSTQAAVPAEALQTPAPAAAPEALSPTLSTLQMSRRPKEATACERCPNSVWFTSPTEVKCYCRVMSATERRSRCCRRRCCCGYRRRTLRRPP